MTQSQTLEILKTGVNVFLTGEPGSGKTHAVNSYISWLRKHGIKPAITASTGIAATHIDGLTLHSFTGIGIAEQLTAYDLDRIASTERIADRINAASILIIDEVSMLSAQTLDMADRVCQEVRRNSQPFGGMQVILVGDFFQLPPVSKTKKAAFAYHSPTWENLNLQTCYLTEQHRQEDAVFLSILSAIRKNSCDESHGEYLAARTMDFAQAPSGITKLYSHNVDVDRINLEELGKIPEEPRKFAMRNLGSKALVEQLKRGCLSPESLELKKGAAVMFTKNSPQGSYVNGTMGKVVGFDETTGNPIIKTNRGLRITAEPVRWSIEDHGAVLASVEQLPLRLAWAITVHKSQGMSMDAAVMDLSGSFEYGQGYVALSRVRSLAGLHLLGLNSRALMVDPQILLQDEIFKNASDATEASLNALTQQELQALHEQFITFCGGTIKEQSPREPAENDLAPSPKKSEKSWVITLRLVQEGVSLEMMPERRGLTLTTIFQHLEELQEMGKLSQNEVQRLAEGKLEAGVEIADAIIRLGDEKLRPIFEYFEGAYNYDDIRLARLLYRASQSK